MVDRPNPRLLSLSSVFPPLSVGCACVFFRKSDRFLVYPFQSYHTPACPPCVNIRTISVADVYLENNINLSGVIGQKLSAGDIGVLVRATYGCHKCAKTFLVVEATTVRWNCRMCVEDSNALLVDRRTLNGIDVGSLRAPEVRSPWAL